MVVVVKYRHRAIVLLRVGRILKKGQSPGLLRVARWSTKI